MTLAEPRVHLWTRDEYYKMGELGLFDGKRVELIEGQVIEMSPIGSPHRTAVTLTGDTLREAFGAGWFVQIQSPLNLGEKSDPEPDVAVIAGNVRDYTHTHPTTAALVVEVADTSLDYDRKVKGSLYAKAGLEDYWILNLLARHLEVYREPVGDAQGRFSYASITTLKATDTIAPLAKPDVGIAVADLLP